MHDRLLQSFFQHIEWGAREQAKFETLRSYVLSMPSDGLRYEYRAFTPVSIDQYSLSLELYWREMLSRLHYASVISRLRADAWFRGIFSAIGEQNTHAFAACLRALIESVADSYHCLDGVSEHLAMKRDVIQDALSRNATDIRSYETFLDQELEDRLIHFSHARGIARRESVPDLTKHKAKPHWEYTKDLPDGPGKILKPAYDDLCQIVHPSSQSSAPFVLIHQDKPELSIYEVRNDLSFAVLIGFSQRHKDVFSTLVDLALDPSGACLQSLELFQWQDAVRS